MGENRRFLLAILLGVVVSIVRSQSFTLSTIPPSLATCHYCQDDSDCQIVMTNSSTCVSGQCANEDGLFGLGCTCRGEGDCASGLCGGFIRSTCQELKDIGQFCSKDNDCKSGSCSKLKVCAAPNPTTASLPIFQNPAASPSDDALQNTAENPDAEIPAENLETADDDNLSGCILCGEDDSLCGDGICLRGLCTDANHQFPPKCITCQSNADCGENYYCEKPGALGRTTRKCRLKRPDGAKCARNERCSSGHCSVLFRCESEGTTATSGISKASALSGLKVWGSVIGATCGVCICLIVIVFENKRKVSSLESIRGCFRCHGDTSKNYDSSDVDACGQGGDNECVGP